MPPSCNESNGRCSYLKVVYSPTFVLMRGSQTRYQATSSPITSTPAALPQHAGQAGVELDRLNLLPALPSQIDLLDAQDARDRAELIERELKLARMGKGDAG